MFLRYERTFPTINGTLPNPTPTPANAFTDPTAPIYIVQGTAGAFIWESFITPQPVWSAVRLNKYGFARITIEAADTRTTLLYEFKSNGDTVDSFTINKAVPV
jgi:hypothetical protein